MYEGSNDTPPIGRWLKAARLSRRQTLSDVAEASGLTKGFLSRLERDQANASVASLMRLCEVLEISVASLFQAHNGELVRRDNYPRINFGGERLAEFVLTPKSEQRLQAILSEIEPGGGSGEELYSLPAEIEFVFVLAGVLSVELEGEELVLSEGDALTFPAHARHGFRNPDPTALARVLWVYAPALALPAPAGAATDGVDASHEDAMLTTSVDDDYAVLLRRQPRTTVKEPEPAVSAAPGNLPH